MINFNALDFNVGRSEEVMFLLTLSVDQCTYKKKLTCSHVHCVYTGIVHINVQLLGIILETLLKQVLNGF